MYHLIINSTALNAKGEKQLERVQNVFADAGKELEIHKTEHAGHAREIAAELTKGGKFADLITMGGDGTLHEVLNGIEDTEKCTLGLIPMGSGNDFASAAGIPSDVASAAGTIAFRQPTAIDYIQLKDGLRSINAVGCGIDVDVLKRAYAGTKTGKGKYFSAFLKSLRHYKSATYKVSWDGGDEREYKSIVACLGNGMQIGGGIKVFPDAKIDDGYMDLIVVDYLSRFRTMLAFMKLSRGKVNSIKEVTHVKCKRAKITPVEDPANKDLHLIQAEGEIYDNIGLDAELVCGKLKFYLPNND